jgi:HEAT repeat protein
MDFGDLLTGLLVLIVGGILGGIGTYLVKPPLDAWLEKRRKAREAREAARRKEEEAAKQLQLADQYALEYRDKLVRELRNLRILDMVRPLDLERTYVRVRIQEAQPMRYADAEEMAALAQGDPNLLFELSQDKLAEEKVESLLPEEALRRHRHMVVLGDPGAGKTTMLKYLCLLSAQAKLGGFPDLPVFVTLNRYAKATQENLLDFIVADVAERYGFLQMCPYLEQRLENGTVLLLLDGLDEVTVGNPEEAEAAYRRTTDGVNRLATRYPKCPIVITCRRAGWKGLLVPTFLTMSVLDFTWEDIQRFVSNWFGEGSDRARRLQGILSQQVRMQALAANPLLLSLIAIVFERDLELPERRAKLYERCVQVLLTEWDAHRGIKRASQFTTDRKRDLLEDIALHYHCQGLRYFPKDDLLEVIAAYLPTVNIPAGQACLVLDEISAQHGLLKEQAADWYGFLHLTLQEYFAAVSLDKGNQLDLTLAHLHNPWWEEVILLLAGMLKDATPLLDTILSERDDIFFSNLLLAGRCLAGTPRIGRVQLREQIYAALKSLIENEYQHWLPRAQAVKTLSEVDAEKGSKYLLDLLCDEELHWQVRAAAADALGASGRKVVVPDLLAFLPNEQLDRNVRERIADALINLCDESTTPHLLVFLSSQEIDPQVRGRIARTLGLLGDKSAVPHLLALLSDQAHDDYLGWYVSGALGDLKALSNPEDLRRLLGDENVYPGARWELAKRIDNLDQTSHIKVIEWISDESLSKEVRWNVARWMGRLSLDDGIIKSELLRLYSEESMDLSIRACVGIALLQLGESQMATELKRFLANRKTDLYVKKKIAEALVEWGEKDIAPQLMTILQEEAPRAFSFVRMKMADLLASLGDATVAGELLGFLSSEQVEPRIRARAADALSALDLNGFMTDVRTLVTDEQVDSLVRSRAAHCLVQAENGVSWLIELLDREDICEEVYLALYNASRQAGVRVFRTEGGYEVLPPQPR